MTREAASSCSLERDQLAERLGTIAKIGSESLVSREKDGERHLLRFGASDATRRRLEALVAAEGECCSFLDLELSEEGDLLLLSIVAPRDAQRLANGLSTAFGATA